MREARNSQLERGSSNAVRKNWHALDSDSTKEDLLAEGQTVSNMIEFGSVVPERENLTYYVISIQWFHRWQKYTGCFKYDEDEDDELDAQRNKDGLPRKDPRKLLLGDYPGEINAREDLKSLIVDTRYSVFANDRDYDGAFFIKNGKKEEQDFKVVDREVWQRLSSKYGGTEIKRKSIAVPTDDPVRSDYVVEVQLRHFKIHTEPSVKYFGKRLTG